MLLLYYVLFLFYQFTSLFWQIDCICREVAIMKCDLCKENGCYNNTECRQNKKESAVAYEGENRKIHETAAKIEAEYYMKKTRIEELIIFCREMGYERIGVAFCIGLKDEAGTLCSYLRNHFSVFSVCCKVCGIPKEELALQKIEPERFEAMCNPLAQAEKLEQDRTELNVTVGLCIGHDILFGKRSHVPVTALVVKDRVLSHNPAGALYTGYYKKKLGGK